MSDNVMVFPNILEHKYVDLKSATKMTGLNYSVLYKWIVVLNEVAYCRFGRKIVVRIDELERLMKLHFVPANR